MKCVLPNQRTAFLKVKDVFTICAQNKRFLRSRSIILLHFKILKIRSFGNCDPSMANFRMLYFVRLSFFESKKLALDIFRDFIFSFIYGSKRNNFSIRQSNPKREILKNTRCLSNCRRPDMKRN